MIKTGGENVASVKVEAVVLAHRAWLARRCSACRTCAGPRRCAPRDEEPGTELTRRRCWRTAASSWADFTGRPS